MSATDPSTGDASHARSGLVAGAVIGAGAGSLATVLLPGFTVTGAGIAAAVVGFAVAGAAAGALTGAMVGSETADDLDHAARVPGDPPTPTPSSDPFQETPHA